MWMDQCFKREGIDKMLANGEIAAFISTHEHMDHYFGFPVVAKIRAPTSLSTVHPLSTLQVRTIWRAPAMSAR